MLSRPLMLSKVKLTSRFNGLLITPFMSMGKLASAKIFLTGLSEHIFICIQQDVTLATACIFGLLFI